MPTQNYSDEEKNYLLVLARKTIESKILRQKLKQEEPLESLMVKLSCFVTLHTANGYLRGCIGNILPIEPLYYNVIHNAENAAFKDPRFMPLSSLEELNDLNIEISILTQPQPIRNTTEIILGKHGIILKNKGRSAVFLPQVAPEQNWNLTTTLDHLSLKAGLSKKEWQDDKAEFQVFEAIVFSENS